MSRTSTLTLAILVASALLLNSAGATAQASSTSRALRKTSVPATTLATKSARALSNVARQTPTPIVVPQLPPATPTPAPQTPTPQTPAAQTPAPSASPQAGDVLEDEDDVVRVESNLVVVPTSVTDAAGQPVQGLKAEDFQLEEEGRRQEIAQLGVAEQVPLDIALLFDVSSSTVKNFDFMKQTAAGFLKEVMKPADRAAIFTIGERPSLAQPLAGANDAAAKLTAIPAAEKSTGTAFYDTLTTAAKYLSANASGRNRRVILVFTDGEDNFSNDVRDVTVAELDRVNRAKERTQTASEKLVAVSERTAGVHRRALQNVMRAVQQSDAVFYSINPSGPGVRLNVISQRAEYGMSQLSEATGGSSFLPASAAELPAVFQRIAAELRAQYLLQYYSNTDAAPGKFLRIAVRTPARADLRVRARQGYYVPRPKQ